MGANRLSSHLPTPCRLIQLLDYHHHLPNINFAPSITCKLTRVSLTGPTQSQNSLIITFTIKKTFFLPLTLTIPDLPALTRGGVNMVTGGPHQIDETQFSAISTSLWKKKQQKERKKTVTYFGWPVHLIANCVLAQPRYVFVCRGLCLCWLDVWMYWPEPRFYLL